MLLLSNRINKDWRLYLPASVCSSTALLHHILWKMSVMQVDDNKTYTAVMQKAFCLQNISFFV